MAITPKLLGVVTDVLQLLGLDVAYEYHDLIFVSDNPFILKCSDQSCRVDIYFNENLEEEKAQGLMALIEAFAENKGLQVDYKGAFSLVLQDDDAIELEFFDLTET